MEGAVWFATEVGMFQGMGMSFGAVSSGAGGEDHVVALADEILIKEGSE
jgi:hypothetical protein